MIDMRAQNIPNSVKFAVFGKQGLGRHDETINTRKEQTTGTVMPVISEGMHWSPNNFKNLGCVVALFLQVLQRLCDTYDSYITRYVEENLVTPRMKQ